MPDRLVQDDYFRIAVPNMPRPVATTYFVRPLLLPAWLDFETPYDVTIGFAQAHRVVGNQQHRASIEGGDGDQESLPQRV